MKTAVFSTHRFERNHLVNANAGRHDLIFIDTRLSPSTCLLATGCRAVSLFVSDTAGHNVLPRLHEIGVEFIALRSAGFNHVDLKLAWQYKMRVARVPAYSPYAVAEHTVGMMLALNRNLIRAHQRIMELNFSLDGLVGFDMNGKTVGIVGTGQIGAVVAKILHGFGCRLLACDPAPDPALVAQYGVTYTSLDKICQTADIITLHVPLREETKHVIDKNRLSLMKPGVMLINTSRGGLIDTKDLIAALKKRRVGSVGLDVYEEEEGLFFEDHSEDVLLDDTIARLMTFKNVLITAHQAFLTETALHNIASTTIENLNCFEEGRWCENEILPASNL